MEANYLMKRIENILSQQQEEVLLEIFHLIMIQ